MPKNVKETNNKKKATTKASTAKKTTVKKVQPKKATVKKEEPKKVVTKKVEVKKEEVKVEKASVVTTEKKGFLEEMIEKLKTDTKFLVAVCIIAVLLAALIFMVCYKRIPRTTDGKQILATVKGKTITADDLFEQLKEEYGTDALIEIIDTYISNKEVKITDEDKEYVQSVVDYYKDYAEYYQTDLATFLANYVGLKDITTEEEFFDFVLEDYKKTLAVVKFIGDNASEKDLKAYYEENYTDKLTTKHILIEVNDDTTDAQALETAKNLIKELDNTDAKNLNSKFEELAKNNSDDTGTFANGGLMEGFTKKDVVSEFWNAAYALKDGEYTKEPVKSTYGYHIILKVSSTPANKYEDIKDTVKKAYAQELLSSDSSLITTKWAELRKQYKLSINDDNMKSIYENTIAKKAD